jgi:molecular chaperone HtpG
MSNWRIRIPFKVDVAGVIELMGSSLYSRPDTAIRELIQNAHDAIQRRRRRDLTYRGAIRIEQDPEARTLTFDDDGIGLSRDEAEKYLGTLGIGVTGLIKRRTLDLDATANGGDAEQDLIGQFGIGLFSAFMLADRIVVESLRVDDPSGAQDAIRWEAGASSEIELSQGERREAGSAVTLHLAPEHAAWSQSATMLEEAVRQYAEYLPIPIFLNDEKTRVNSINVAWFDASPDPEAIELALESFFHETPLAVIPLRSEKPIAAAGALYVTPQRAPGFSGEPVVTATLRRMVISRRIQGLLPPWAAFVRGVLELADCSPTASREDLVRDASFAAAQAFIDERLFAYFEGLARDDAERWQAILSWHHYTLVGSALTEPRLRRLLSRTYRLPTSRGPLTFDEILEQSAADFLVESDVDRVVWFNADRRQDGWINKLFGEHPAPCVHVLRGFEESLLAQLVADANESGVATALRPASPSAPHFAQSVLEVSDLEAAPAAWQTFFASTGAKLICASFRDDQPVMAFLNERYELYQTLDDLKKKGAIPAGFQRLIDDHFQEEPTKQNEVLLNRNHRLVARALEQSVKSPLASVLRLLVYNALASAGASLPAEARSLQADDLEWIADALWGKST